MKNKTNFHYLKYIFSLLLLSSYLVPSLAAAAPLEVVGWIPYWRMSEGIRSARSNLEVLDAIYPFGYTVKSDGSLVDSAKLKSSSWKRLFTAAKSEKVDIIPSIMWSDAQAMHAVLSNEDLRENHVEEIARMVKRGKYAGVDIDYEGKLAATKDYFSLFLEELKDELGNKELVCTIEARTPPESLYREVPPVISYANDYRVISRHCDVVQLMTYDQMRADLKLNSAKIGSPYMPVADVDWVRKVVNLTLKDIPKEKLMLGVPTYGYEYQVLAYPQQFRDYIKLWSFNPGYIDEVRDDRDVTPSRNQAGEMSVTYFATSSPYVLLNNLPVPAGTTPGNEAAMKALTFANATGQSVPFNFATWSDAEAIEQKVKLAEEFGLRGVAIFKIDGGEDKELWEIFE